MEEKDKKYLQHQALSYGSIAVGLLLVINNTKLGGWAGGIGLLLIVVGASKAALTDAPKEVVK